MQSKRKSALCFYGSYNVPDSDFPPKFLQSISLCNPLDRPHTAHFSLSDSDRVSIAYMHIRCTQTESNRPYMEKQ